MNTTWDELPFANGFKVVSFSKDISITYEIECEDRKSCWQQLAIDRLRFKKRIENAEQILSPILYEQYQRRNSERASRSTS